MWNPDGELPPPKKKTENELEREAIQKEQETCAETGKQKMSPETRAELDALYKKLEANETKPKLTFFECNPSEETFFGIGRTIEPDKL